MADLGVVPLRDPFPVARPELLPVTDYDVVRGRYLGAITLREPDYPLAFERRATLSNYIVRQTRILFAQLWPPYGQRFPQ